MTENGGDIVKVRATVRSGAYPYRISHPTLWIWTEPDGTERSYDTKREAVAARAAYIEETS